jgi:hypothetical protein
LSTLNAARVATVEFAGVSVMHDCRNVNSRLIDLVFDELQADEKLRLVAEVETCAVCLSEYRSMTGTLLVFDKAAEASLPDESYWPEHRAMLSRRLAPATLEGSARRREPLWKRIFTARLPVPAPVAAIITLALLFSSALALRPSTKNVTTPAPMPAPMSALTAAPPTLIEVPVVREKVVTRTVYVWKKQRDRNEARRESPQAQRDDMALTARHAESESGEGGIFTRANLTGFRPPDELRIRIVKRSNSDEN